MPVFHAFLHGPAMRATGAGNETSAPQMIDVIRNAGRIPARRDSSYRII